MKSIIKDAKALENAPLEILFTNNATAKILDFIIAYQEWDYSISDIARYSGVSVKSVERELPKLLHYGFIVETRRVGRAKMYKFNKDDKISTLIEKFVLELAYKDIKD